MLDYSVYMQTNHLAPEVGERAYARLQIRENWDDDKFINHLASHNAVFTRGTFKGVISDVCNCIVEQVLNGNKIALGELGTFHASISCESADDMEKFTAENIKAVNLVFTPGPDFENMIGKATFNPVTSRKLQAAALKAQKKKAAVIDLNALNDDSSSSTPSGEDDEEDDSTQGGSTGGTPTQPDTGGNDDTTGGSGEE